MRTYPTTQPTIAVMPYGGKLGKSFADLPLSDLHWPLGCPDRLLGKRGRDLAPGDHLIVYAKRAMHFQSLRHCPAQVSLMVMEPKIMSAAHHHLLRLSARRFLRVFTFDPDLLARLPNGVMLPFGTTWVPEWQQLEIRKEKDLSLIASAKRDHPGHKLRHRIAEHLQRHMPQAEILGQGYLPFHAKSDGLAPYRYSVVIENVQELNYFSEKLIDAILCETVPIYWGCPNVAEYFPGEGMIVCKDQAEIEAVLQHVSAEDYARRLPALKHLQEPAAFYGDLPKRAAEALQASL